MTNIKFIKELINLFIYILIALAYYSLILLLLFVTVDYLHVHFYNPERVKNIPVSAQWHGGSDGWLWFDLLEYKDSVYTFDLYAEDGTRIERSEYVLDCDCVKSDTISNRIHEYISHDDLTDICLTIYCNNKRCKLKFKKRIIDFFHEEIERNRVLNKK